MSEPMWEYWRDKKGHIRALEEQYPEEIENDWGIHFALEQIKQNLAYIDFLMKQKGI